MKSPRLPQAGAFFAAVLVFSSFHGSYGKDTAADSETLDSIRFLERPDGKAELLTGVTSFENAEGQTVDLVGVVHIADTAYYEDLNERLAAYDVVLYEMVGGPLPERNEQASNATVLLARVVQRMAESALGLKYQLDAIDYTSPHFVHADATWEEWKTLMEARQENMLTMFARAMDLEGDSNLEEQVQAMNSEETMAELTTSLTNLDPNRFKRAFASMLAESESYLDALEGEEGTVLIGERNKIVMQSVDEQLAGGKQRIAVFYGAGHSPDLARRLEASGFERRDTHWLKAWEIGENGESIDGFKIVETLLKDDQLIESVVNFFRAWASQ